MAETMNIAIVQLECTLEGRAQARKRLVVALAAMLKEIMQNSTLLAYGKESDVNGAHPEAKTERSE